MQNNYPRFKCWSDKAHNVGVQCLDCTRTHWTSEAPATDPVTNEPCANCQLIKDSNVLAVENRVHKTEHVTTDSETLETVRNDVECTHQASQPDLL